MATQLRQILAFTNVAPSGQATLTHNLNTNGTAAIPDEVKLDTSDFSIISVTSTQVTVQNDGTSAASCNVQIELWHSTTRVLGASTSPGTNAGLTPRPFVHAV